MSDKDDGGPAFPCPADDLRLQERGMSLRDWFAGEWLQGRMASGVQIPMEAFRPKETSAQWLARNAYDVADAMLEARK